jgi:hypothetical protein
MKLTPENKVKARLKEILAAHNAYTVSITTMGFGESGHPDILACIDGYFFGFECKATAKQQPTALQVKRLRDLRAAGGASFVIDADNIDSLGELLNNGAMMARTRTTGDGMSGCEAYWR